MRYIKIPKERVAVLIGKNGEIKEKIEEHGVKLEIDSATGDIKIIGEDSLKEYDAENVIRAIGRGFSPDKAMLLFKEDYYFELLDMRDWVGKKPEQVKRIAGRVIGKNGKTRRIIEELTGAYISVYGHTVGIIGKIDELQIARQAVEMLLEGANHNTVYRFLEKERRMKKLRELGFFERKI